MGNVRVGLVARPISSPLFLPRWNVPHPSRAFLRLGWESTNPILTALYQGMSLLMPQTSQKKSGL